MRTTKESNKKNVGAGPVSAQKGITLIALVITIIVMLILVGVTISMAVNGGLFDYAGKAERETKNKINEEQELAKGGIEVNGVKYDSIDDYLAGEPSGPVKIKLGKTGTRVTTVPVPDGFTHTEGTVDTGYVIQDGDGNEFVWVPVDKEQKITIEVESEEDIDKLQIYDPYGDIILEVEDGDIETTYKNVEVPTTVNGMYMAVTTQKKEDEEEPIITQKTITVKSLYALDTMNDWGTTDEFAKTAEFDTIEEYALDLLSGYSFPSVEAGLAYFNVPTLEVGISMINTSMIAFWKDYEDIEDYSAYVEKNGGFYIARYEAGAPTVRTSGNANDPVATIISNHGTPVSKEGYAPYNNVTHGQAKGLAESMYGTNDEYEVSLITGSGWDRTLGWIQETKSKSVSEIYNNSRNWGNYYYVTFDITKGKYSENYGDSYTDVSGTYTKPARTEVLLTTGATTRNSAKNIFDLAGNIEEWTNETYSSSDRVIRIGGIYDGGDWQASARYGNNPDLNSWSGGFRSALYLK